MVEKDKPISRRQFFKQGLQQFHEGLKETVTTLVAPQEENVADKTPLLIRPPGALPENDFLEKCTRCNECVKVCPEEAIMKFVGEGSKNHLTPMLNMRKTACVLCEDLPCISVCEPKALVFPESPAAVRMGTAVVNEKLCYAWADGADCDYCVRACPFPGDAIYLDKKRRPHVAADTCTGCGLCENICPTRQAAVVVIKGKEAYV